MSGRGGRRERADEGQSERAETRALVSGAIRGEIRRGAGVMRSPGGGGAVGFESRRLS